MENILTGYLNSGKFPSKYKWKKLLHEKVNDSAVLSIGDEANSDSLKRFFQVPP